MKTQALFRSCWHLPLLCLLWGFQSHGAVIPAATLDRTNVVGAGGSFLPAFSADGRFVVFVSHAKNLVTNQAPSPWLDVFVRDLVASNTILVSVNTNGTGGGNADANFASISSNGQFVAFASSANNLVTNDPNDASDIFVRDLVSGLTTLVSVDNTGTSSAGVLTAPSRYRLSSNPLISADGRWVIFESLAANLTALSDGNQATDIFARDLRSNITYLVSVNAAGTGSGNRSSDSPSISPDGRFVAFVSTATDLVSGNANQSGDVYVRDLQTGTTSLASSNPAPLWFGPTGFRCANPAISADGHAVAFKATVDPPWLLIHHDLQTGVSTMLTPVSDDSVPAMSADGRFVASERLNDLYLWDIVTGSNGIVSVNATGTGGGNQASQTPIMTPDGGTVVFLSAATDLTTNAMKSVSQVFARDLVNGRTRLVSANLEGFASSRNIDVTSPSVSADGRFVVFESLGADLVANDLNRASDVFLRDLEGETTQLVSVRDSGLPERTGSALTTVFANLMSAEGRFLAFGSLDSNLVSDDEDEGRDLFVRDLFNDPFFRLSVDRKPTEATQIPIEPAMSSNGRYLVCGIWAPDLFPARLGENIVRYDLQNGTNVIVSLGASSNPAISSDGNLVAFQSPFQSHTNIFVTDMLLGTNKLVSVNRRALGDAGNGDSVNCQFSPDDRWIVFASTAPDLLTNDLDGSNELFARDLLSNTTRLISVGPNGRNALGYLRGAVVSADSRHVAFVGSNSTVIVYDFASGTGSVICTGCDLPSISADGRLVTYETTNGGGPRQIMVQDRQTGLTETTSPNRLGTGGGNGDSSSPLLSWNGRFVVFASKAGDLVDDDTNGVSDIFVRDRLLGTTLLASLNWDGKSAGNGPSTKPVLAADARTVAFQSFASNLVPGDYNYRRDVFTLRLGGPDSDGDGMDDDWEMAYFGTLARDGSGDFDSDGRTDLQEFQAGTDPTNAGSILRALTVTPQGGGATKVLWSAVPGKRYQVQFKDDLAGSGWARLPSVTLANGTTASLLDDSPGPHLHRFYRVILAP